MYGSSPLHRKSGIGGTPSRRILGGDAPSGNSCSGIGSGMASFDNKLTALQRDFLAAFFKREQRFFLTGDAALVGFYLGHRSTHDLDLFSVSDVLDEGAAVVGEIARQFGASLESIQTAPDFRRMLESQIAQAGGKPPAAPQSLQIPVQVTLDPQLASRVTGEMPVFIYARAGGQGGPPLAVVRRSVAELPLTVVLDDSQSMLPERKLSSVDQWTITARVARQGSAESRSGDLVADTVVTRGQLPGPILLRIDRSVS